jgi:hypothetical protein
MVSRRPPGATLAAKGGWPVRIGALSFEPRDALALPTQTTLSKPIHSIHFIHCYTPPCLYTALRLTPTVGARSGSAPSASSSCTDAALPLPASTDSGGRASCVRSGGGLSSDVETVS